MGRLANLPYSNRRGDSVCMSCGRSRLRPPSAPEIINTARDTDVSGLGFSGTHRVAPCLQQSSDVRPVSGVFCEGVSPKKSLVKITLSHFGDAVVRHRHPRSPLRGCLTEKIAGKNRRTLSHEDTRGDLPLTGGVFAKRVAIWIFGSGRVKGSPIPGLRCQRRSGRSAQGQARGSSPT
jgi:hypothetical protein